MKIRPILLSQILKLLLNLVIRDSILVTRLRSGQSGVSVPAGARDQSFFFKNVHTCWGAHSISYPVGARGSSGVKLPGVRPNTLPHLLQRWRAWSYTSAVVYSWCKWLYHYFVTKYVMRICVVIGIVNWFALREWYVTNISLNHRQWWNSRTQD